MLEIKERVMQIRMVTSCVLAGLVIGSASAASAREVVYPPQMFEENRIIDVTRPPYNADPSGQEDATKAIQLAISQNVGRQTGSLDAMPMILYFPNGTYRISDTLKWQDENGRWRAMLVLQGQSQDGVVIRLADEAADFQEPAEPKPMILTADRAKLEGSDAFHNFVFDLTIDVGVGNPGAVGLDYLANNLAAVRNVTIRSSDPAGAGAIGLNMPRKHPGPKLLKDLTIEGFDVGIQIRDTPYSVTIEGLKLRGQRDVGIETDSNVLAIRHLESDLQVPVVRSPSDRTLLVMMDSTIAGGVDNTAAVINAGQTYLRNVSAAGSDYVELLEGTDALAGKRAIEGEWHTGAPLTMFAPADKQLLEVRETPAPEWDSNFENWANVMDYGACPDDRGGDHTEAIDAAMRSGKPVIFFPPARREGGFFYRVNRTIEVPDTVKHIIGNQMVLMGMFEPQEAKLTGNEPVLRFVNGQGTSVTLEGLTIRHGINSVFQPTAIEVAGEGEVVLRDVVMSSLKNAPNAGPLFLENVVSSYVLLDHPQQVWARHLNPENHEIVKLTNRGGQLWVFGYKTERASTALQTLQGGRSEIYGASIMSNRLVPQSMPALVVKDSQMRINFATISTGGPRTFHDVIQATRGEQTEAFHRTDGYHRGAYEINNIVALASIDASGGASVPATGPTDLKAIQTDMPSISSLPSSDHVVQWLDASHPMQRLPDGRVLRWVDASGKGNDGVRDELVANPVWSADAVDGKPGLHFDEGAFMAQTGRLTLKEVSGWTTVVRFKTGDELTGRQVIVGNSDGVGGITIYLQEDRLVVAVGHPGQTQRWTVSYLLSDPLKPSTIYNFAVVCRFGENFDGTLNAWLNGNAIGEASGLQRIFNMGTGRMTIGNTQGGIVFVRDLPGVPNRGGREHYFRGWISRIIQWDKALPADEARTLSEQ